MIQSDRLVAGFARRDPTVHRRRRSLLFMRDTILSPDGDVLYESPDWIPNALADEGEASMLNVYFRSTAAPSKYLALLNMPGAGVPTDTTTMATMTESIAPGTNGYNRQQVVDATDWPSAPALNSGDMQITAAQKTFGAFTGAVTVSHVAVVTVATGTAGLFLIYLPTAYYTANTAARAFASGESYLVTLSSKQQ